MIACFNNQSIKYTVVANRAVSTYQPCWIMHSIWYVESVFGLAITLDVQRKEKLKYLDYRIIFYKKSHSIQITENLYES